MQEHENTLKILEKALQLDPAFTMPTHGQDTSTWYIMNYTSFYTL